MNFAVEENLRALVNSLSFPELFGNTGTIAVKRGDTPAFNVQFGTAFAAPRVLATPLTLVFGAKVQGDDDGSYVTSNYNTGSGLYVYTYTSGAGLTANIYTIAAPWNTAKLNNLLGFDPNGFAEVTELRTVADVAANLDGTWFKLFDHAGSVGVWFALNNDATAAPAGAAACARQIKITTVDTNDTASTIAGKIATALGADGQFTDTTASGNLVSIVDSAIGARTAAIDGTTEPTGFALSVWIIGAAPNSMARVPSIILDGEIRYNENGVIASTVTFDIVVSFDVNNATPSSPVETEPAYPAPGLLLTTSASGACLANGAQNGRAAIGNAAASLAVVFPNAFTAAPQLVGTPCIEKAADGDDDIFCTGVSSLTDTGFTAHFSAPTGNANYHLHWYAFLPSA